MKAKTAKWGQEIRQLYVVEKYSTYRVAAILGLQQASVWKYLKRQGLLRQRTYARKHTINSAVFDQIDHEEAAYWLGFIAADGCVYKNRLRVSLKGGDSEHLDTLNTFLGSSKPLDYETRACTNGTMCDSVTLDVCSSTLVVRLRELGIVSRKSTVYEGRPTLEPHLVRHYYRGYVDGDGSIGYRPLQRNNSHSVSLVGTRPFLEEWQEWLVSNTGVRPTTISCEGGYWRNIHGGRHVLYKVVSLLYGDATVALARKWNIAERVINEYVPAS